jgi:hypothetical protein
MTLQKFYHNKYFRWYEQIVSRAKSRILPKDCYVEQHHIIPKSMGGNNSKSNLVNLTAREHFICHWLLTKFVDANYRGKMIKALSCMKAQKSGQLRYSTIITSKVYENIRTELSLINGLHNKGRPAWNRGICHLDDDAKKRISQARKQTLGVTGKYHRDEDNKAKLRLASSVPVMTPDGIFPSKTSAAEFYKIHRNNFSIRMKKYPELYYALIEKNKKGTTK